MKGFIFLLFLLPSVCFSGGVIPLMDYAIKDNVGIRTSVVYEYEGRIVEFGGYYFPTILQLVYSGEHYEIGFGTVNTLNFKFNI